MAPLVSCISEMPNVDHSNMRKLELLYIAAVELYYCIELQYILYFK